MLDFFAKKEIKEWMPGDAELDEIIAELNILMLRLDQHAEAYEQHDIIQMLAAMDCRMDASWVRQKWAVLKQLDRESAKHDIAGLTQTICEHVAFDQRIMLLGQLWPSMRHRAIPDKHKEAIFEWVASLLGFEDKTFLDSCIKRRPQRLWELTESEQYGIIATLLMSIMWVDGKADQQESENIWRILVQHCNMDEHDIMHKFAEFEHIGQDKIASNLAWQAEKLCYSIEEYDRGIREDYGRSKLMGNLWAIAKADGELDQHEIEFIQRLESLLKSVDVAPV